jgi:poly(A) polymerase
VQLLDDLQGFFAARHLPAYLVGGFLRDTLLGKPTRDIDIGLEGPTEVDVAARDLAQFLSGTVVPLDSNRGIFRVVLADRRNIDLSGMPKGVKVDLPCRDFTINAMAVSFPKDTESPDTWALIDPCGGQEDLRKGLVRMVSPAVFRSDPARLLRAIRLAAQLQFDIDPETLDLLSREATLINQVAAERIRDELLNILAQPNLARSLTYLSEYGLLDFLIPELLPAKGVTQPFEHYWDVYQHSLQCAVMVENVLNSRFRQEELAGQVIPWEPWLDEHFAQEASDGHTRATLLKLAALLHDVSKPETKTVEPSGRARFLGHPTLGAKKAVEIAQRFRISGRGVTMLNTLVEQHLRPSHLAQRADMPTRKAIYRYYRDLNDLGVDLLYLNMADYLAARGPTLELQPWQFHCSRIARTLEYIVGETGPTRETSLVDGNDLINFFGLKPGPEFRPLLETVREAQATGEITTRDEAIEFLKRDLGQSFLRVQTVGDEHA